MKRKIYRVLSASKQILFTLALILCCGMAYSQATYTLSYTGSMQTVTLQPGTYSVECWGGDGGGTTGTNSSAAVVKLGGKGGYAAGTLTLSAVTVASVYVAGKGNTEGVNVPGGFNGGGNSGAGSLVTGVCGSGGGASDIRVGGNTFNDRKIVAGGGGAAGYQECNGAANAISGGHGGGLVGGSPVVGAYAARIGHGGTQTAGGAGGTDATYVTGNPGSFGLGANGGTASVASGNGAGGGGGWYGGGSGSNGFYCAGGGGGGSSYIGGVTSGTTIMFGQTGFVANPDVSGNGLVIIKELCSITLYAAGNTNSLNPMLCAGQSATLMTNAISNYSWSNGSTASSLVVAPTTNTVYSLSATSPSNCTSSKSISITVSSGLPVLSIANPSNNICLGRTVSLTATGALTYTWSNPGVVNGQTFSPTATTAYTVTGQNGCGTSVATTTITVAPLAVSASANSTLVCQGYATTLTAVSAVTGFTWQPNNSSGSTAIVAPVANTIYTVTASDGTCAGTATIAITTKQTPTITASASSTNICEGSQVVLTASGASTYTWNPGNQSGNTVTVSPATSTLYVVNGINNVGCESSASQIVLVNPAPPVTVAANKTLVCVGDPIVLTAGGGNTYSWTNGPQGNTYTVTPNGPTDYTVTGIGQNGCPKTRTISVAVVVPNVVVPSSVAVCSGVTATITASGATTYSWNGFNLGSPQYFITPLTNTTVVLTANSTSLAVNCLTNHTINIAVNQNPTITVVATKTTVCRNQPTTLSASGAASYNWGTLGTTSSVVVSPSVQTIYQVTGTDANGCEGQNSFIVKVVSCNGIAETSINSTVSVFPNPSSGAFYVSAESAIQLKLSNDLGQDLGVITLDENNGYKVEVKDLANGIYFLSGVGANAGLYYKVVVTK